MSGHFFQAGKLDNLLKEMDRIRIDCLRLCETRWTNTGEFSKEKRKIFYSGGSKHQRGIALVLNDQFAKSVLSFWPKN